MKPTYANNLAYGSRNQCMEKIFVTSEIQFLTHTPNYSHKPFHGRFPEGGIRCFSTLQFCWLIFKYHSTVFLGKHHTKAEELAVASLVQPGCVST